MDSRAPSAESPPDPASFARSYQLEAFEKAMKQNTIVFLDTGSGKTLIAVMLLRGFAHQIRKPSEHVAIFLVPTVVLVSQQADVIEKHTDLKVGRFWGDMGVDFWDVSIWKEKLDTYEVFVMTPQILLNNLRHCFFDIKKIALLIFDECHHAKGKHPYALIMTEFYHRNLKHGSSYIPRVLGMTASIINSKGSNCPSVYQRHILELETLMNSKVYTVVKESIMAEYIPFSTVKIRLHDNQEIPVNLSTCMEYELGILKDKYLQVIEELDFDNSTKESLKERIMKLFNTFLFCLKELGLWLTLKASEIYASKEDDTSFWGPLRDPNGEKQVNNFGKDASILFARFIPSGYLVGCDFEVDVHAGYLTRKVVCLVQSLLDYRHIENLRCIVFVERVITAMVLKILLCTIPQIPPWGIRHMAGYRSGWLCQSRHEHLSTVDLFREGKVNIIVATQILEEGLDVQSCNLVIRFDPSPTVCSFIQSRGRARLRGSDYLLILNRNDSSTLLRVRNYLESSRIMREESLHVSSFPCGTIADDLCDEAFYCVESTGAIVNLNSSVQLIYFYCSRLPSDRYFKPQPRFLINEEHSCKLLLPGNSPISSVSVNDELVGDLKQIACLKACKELHQCGALNDYLLPVVDVVEDITHAREPDNSSLVGYSSYYPSELIDSWLSFCDIGQYHIYCVSFTKNFDRDISFRDIIFVVKLKLNADFTNLSFDLDAEWGVISVTIKYLGSLNLTCDEVLLAKRFQAAILSIVVYRNFDILRRTLDHFHNERGDLAFAYLLLPSTELCVHPFIDWNCVSSEKVLQPTSDLSAEHNCLERACRPVQMRNGVVNSCMIGNSIVYTAHSNYMYLVTGSCEGLSGYSQIELNSGEVLSYTEFYKARHGIILCHPKELLLAGQHIVCARNCLNRNFFVKKRDSHSQNVALPAELCEIILSPVDGGILYSFSILPSVMSRIESLLLSSRIVRLDQAMKKFAIPAFKVLEAITTKKCREKFSLESLETLGDSFLKYAATVDIFDDNKFHHEGILTSKREHIISNNTLYRLACNKNLQGFIRNVEFDPKNWNIPGACHGLSMDHDFRRLELKNVVGKGTRYIKKKVISDLVEALIGLYLTTHGESGAIQFMNWLGMDIKRSHGLPKSGFYLPTAEMFANITALESILNYKFRDSSFLVEALTHGSFQSQDLPRCYQLLEFLGDAVLDYLITIHMYNQYPGISPGLLTDLRSASVNNDCYAHAAVKAGLNKHILHASLELHRQIEFYIDNLQKSFFCSSYGWDAGIALPKVLGDVIESLAGAIFVDSGYNKDTVWQSMKPLLEPLVTPETLEYHPVRELNEICSRRGYEIDYDKVIDNALTSVTVRISVGSTKVCETKTAINKKTAKKLAAKAALEALKLSCFPN